MCGCAVPAPDTGAPTPVAPEDNVKDLQHNKSEVHVSYIINAGF